MKRTKWKISLGRLVDENMERILVPNDFLLPTDNDNKEAIANAKLIASAPEMLEALINLIKEHDLGIVTRIDRVRINALIKQATE